MRKILLLFLCNILLPANAQEIKCTLKKSTVVKDEYSFSEIVAVGEDGDGGVTVARSYTSLFGKTFGYYFEHYNDKLIKVKSFKQEMKKKQRLVGVVIDGNTLNMIEFTYDKVQKAYVCYANSCNVKDFKFTKKELFRLAMQKEKVPLMSFDANVARFEDYYHAKIVFSEDNSSFGILVNINIGKDKDEVHEFYAFNNKMDLLLKNSLVKDYEDYGFEIVGMDVSQDTKTAYVLGKQKNKKDKKGTADYFFDVTSITDNGTKTYSFDVTSNFPCEMKMVLKKDKVTCVGLYEDKDEKWQKGICYYDLDQVTLGIKSSKIIPFPQDFAALYNTKSKEELKYFQGRELYLAENNDVIYNAEQYDLGMSRSANPSSSIVHARHAFGDILSVKINDNGEALWFNAIDKYQIGDDTTFDFLSYTSFIRGGDIYFFLNGTIKPKDDGGLFVDFTPAPFGGVDFNVMRLNKDGKIDYKKLLDTKKEKTRMLIKKRGLMPNGASYFLHALGKEKQLYKLTL